MSNGKGKIKVIGSFQRVMNGAFIDITIMNHEMQVLKTKHVVIRDKTIDPAKALKSLLESTMLQLAVA